MRYIRVPERKVTIEGEEWTFQRWLLEAMLRDDKFGVNVSTLQMSLDIQQRVRETEDGVIQLSDAEWQILSSVVDAPSRGYVTRYALPLMEAGYMKAVKEAVPAKPKS